MLLDIYFDGSGISVTEMVQDNENASKISYKNSTFGLNGRLRPSIYTGMNLESWIQS
jgi:hypothetical protein